MRVSSSADISKALLTELKALREKHQQFQTRVKAAEKAARTRDEQARKQNEILMQRVLDLKNDLKEAIDSIEVRMLLLLLSSMLH